MNGSDYIVDLSFSSLICSPKKYKTSFSKQFAGTWCTKHLLRVTVVTQTKLEQEHYCYYACANLMCDVNKHKHNFSVWLYLQRNSQTTKITFHSLVFTVWREQILSLSLYNQLDFENHYRCWLQDKVGNTTKLISLISTQKGIKTTSICWLLVVREAEGRQRTWPPSQYQDVLNTGNWIFLSCASVLLLKLTLNFHLKD